MTLVTQMSNQGQIFLPKALRETLKLEDGVRFVIFHDGENLLLKPIKEPSLSDFEQVMEQAQLWAKEVKLKEEDIDEAIKCVRSRKHENCH